MHSVELAPISLASGKEYSIEREEIRMSTRLGRYYNGAITDI